MEDIFCSPYDWELFFRIVISIVPNALRKAAAANLKFFVKGGRAADAYLDKPIGSPDWDLAANKSDIPAIAKIVIDEITSYGIRVKTDSVTLEVRGRPPAKGTQIGIPNCGGLYAVEIIPISIGYGVAGVAGVVASDGIPYAPLDYLLLDLRETVEDRAKIVVEAKEEYDELFEKSKQMEEESKNELFEKEDQVRSLIEKSKNSSRLEDAFDEYVSAVSNARRFSGASVARRNALAKLEGLVVKSERTQARLTALQQIKKTGKQQ